MILYIENDYFSIHICKSLETRITYDMMIINIKISIFVQIGPAIILNKESKFELIIFLKNDNLIKFFKLSGALDFFYLHHM